MEKMWYYSENGTDRKGPLPESEFRQLQLPPSTLVWSEGMPSWAPFSSLGATAAPAAPAAGSASPLRLNTPAPAAPSAIAPAFVPTHATPPEGLGKWMSFVGVMNIIGGVFASLSCIGLIYGIPMIMGGAALLTAKNLLFTLTAVDAGTSAFLEKLHRAFKLTGWAYILMIIVSVLFMVVYGVFMATIMSKVMHNLPTP